MSNWDRDPESSSTRSPPSRAVIILMAKKLKGPLYRYLLEIFDGRWVMAIGACKGSSKGPWQGNRAIGGTFTFLLGLARLFWVATG